MMVSQGVFSEMRLLEEMSLDEYYSTLQSYFDYRDEEAKARASAANEANAKNAIRGKSKR